MTHRVFIPSKANCWPRVGDILRDSKTGELLVVFSLEIPYTRKTENGPLRVVNILCAKYGTFNNGKFKRSKGTKTCKIEYFRRTQRNGTLLQSKYEVVEEYSKTDNSKEIRAVLHRAEVLDRMWKVGTVSTIIINEINYK
jgi:hypothetical protein